MRGLENAYKYPKNQDYFSQIYREHFVQTYQSMLFCKMLKPVKEDILISKKLNLPSIKGLRFVALSYFYR